MKLKYPLERAIIAITHDVGLILHAKGPAFENSLNEDPARFVDSFPGIDIEGMDGLYVYEVVPKGEAAGGPGGAYEGDEGWEWEGYSFGGGSWRPITAHELYLIARGETNKVNELWLDVPTAEEWDQLVGRLCSGC